MARFFSSSRPSHASPAFPRHLVLAALGFGAAATALCAGFLFAEPLAGPLNMMSPTYDRHAPLGQLFGVNAAVGNRQGTKILAGVGGETFAPGSNRVAMDEIISDSVAANIKPVAWERLSGGGCMIVTTKSGQTYSFRLQGTRQAPAKDANAARNTVELAIAPCTTDNAETVVKAVIVPAPETPHKPTAAERSL